MIRMLRDEDIPACLALYNWYIENSTATFETDTLLMDDFVQRVKRITTKYPWIILEEDGEVKGYAYLDAFHERTAYRFMCDVSIYIDHDARGRGYGSKLMEAILSLSEKDGYHKAISIVTSDNSASIHLHEKMGFRKFGQLDNCGYKAEKWLGVIYFEKVLHEPCDTPEETENYRI